MQKGFCDYFSFLIQVQKDAPKGGRYGIPMFGIIGRANTRIRKIFQALAYILVAFPGVVNRRGMKKKELAKPEKRKNIRRISARRALKKANLQKNG